MPNATAEQIQMINELRAKIANNTISIEEMRKGIELLRGGRASATAAALESKASGGKKEKKPTRSADEMLAELGI
jgi:uncharacterized coiled-coil protein SlyX